jgi:predicted peptidase
MKFTNPIKEIDHPSRALWICLLFVPGIICCSQKRGEEVHFKSAAYQNAELRFLLYDIKDHVPDKAYPLMVYLHGSNATGENLSMVKTDGIPKIIEDGKELPFVVIAPQLPSGMAGRWPPEFVNEFITYARENYGIDSHRICVTGVSMGGSGVWDYTSTYPTQVACAVPMSCWGDAKIICNMKAVPTWAFHGIDDPVVSINSSRNLTNTLRECGGQVTLTELPDAGHDAWKKAYVYPGLFEWISSQSRSDH